MSKKQNKTEETAADRAQEPAYVENGGPEPGVEPIMGSKEPYLRTPQAIVGYLITAEELETYDLVAQLGMQGYPAVDNRGLLTVGKTLNSPFSPQDLESVVAEVEVTIGRLFTGDLENGNKVLVHLF